MTSLSVTSFRAQYAVSVTLLRNWVPIFVGLAIPSAGIIADYCQFSLTVPMLGTFPGVFFVMLGLNGLLGIADSFREPASMALFADEGKGSGIASCFGIRELVWRPGALMAPLLGGYLMDGVGMKRVFYVGGATALTGAVTFVGIVAKNYGPRELLRW